MPLIIFFLQSYLTFCLKQSNNISSTKDKHKYVNSLLIVKFFVQWGYFSPRNALMKYGLIPMKNSYHFYPFFFHICPHLDSKLGFVRYSLSIVEYFLSFFRKKIYLFSCYCVQFKMISVLES